MSSPSEQRSPFIRWIDAFLQEENIKWILGLGVCILLGSSLRLVTLHWEEYTPVWKYLVLLSYTVAVHVLGQLTYHRLGLRKTGTVLMSLTVLLIPLNFLSLHWIQPRVESPFADGAWTAGLSSLLGLNLIGSTLAANRIFVHFLRKPQFTFLACYLTLCVAGAVVPGLPTSWSSVMAFFLWAVFAVGTIKVNRHVFWLTEEHRLSRIFGFFPIALLGTQFSAVFALGIVSHLSLAWIGLLCTLVSLPILLSADALAQVFEQRTGGLVRPIPWSISGPLVLGMLLNVGGVIMSLTGWPSQTQIVPTAFIAAASMGMIARRTRKTAFAWGMVVMILIAYQTSPALAKELVLRLRDSAAVAVNESRLPYAFYGLTYAPLIAIFSVAAARLQRAGNTLFGIPLQMTATCLALGLFAASFTHSSAVFPVALVLLPLFVGQLLLHRQRFYLVPAAATVLACIYGFPGFAERVWGLSVTPECHLLLWSVASTLLLMPGAFFDCWSKSFCKSKDSVFGSRTLDHVFQLFSLASAAAAAGIWVRLTFRWETTAPDLMLIDGVLIGAMLVVHALRWLKPGLGEITLIFGTYAIQWYLTGCEGWSLTPVDTVCTTLLIQWGLSYLLARNKTNRLGRAFGRAIDCVPGFGLAIAFSFHFLQWLFAHIDASATNWTMSLLLMAWALDAARRSANRAWSTIVWCSLFVLVSAFCTTSIDVERFFASQMTIVTMTGLALVAVRRMVLALVLMPVNAGAEQGNLDLSPERKKMVAWVEPLASILPLFFATSALISLMFLDLSHRLTGMLALGGLLAMDRSWVRTMLMEFAGPVLNWQILVGAVGVVTRASGDITSLPESDMAVIDLPLAGLSALSCLLFEWRLVRDRIKFPELIGAHQTSLITLTFWMLCQPFHLHSSFTWTICNFIWTIVTFTALIVFAARVAVRTHDSRQAWVAEFLLGVSILYIIGAGVISWTSPELMYVVIGLSLLHSALAKWAARSKDLAVLSEPLRLTGFWLPLVILPLALLREADSSAVDWAGANSLPLLGAATIYFWRGLEQRRVGTMFLSAAILNVAFALLWGNLGWTDPQLFMFPIGISILAVTELLRAEIPTERRLSLRIVGSLTILVSPVFHIVSGSWSHILTLMIASAALAIIAIGLQVRSLLYMSTAFLLADLVALVARSSADEPNILWIAGIVLGAAILAMGAVCEKHREQLLARIRCLAAELEQWN